MSGYRSFFLSGKNSIAFQPVPKGKKEDSTAVRLLTGGLPEYNWHEVMAMFQIDKQKFGAFVAELRKEKGYTQKELAQRLLISDKAVSKWETGVSQS